MRIDPNQFMDITNKSQSTVERGSYSDTLEHTKTERLNPVSGHVLSIKENTYEKPVMDTKEKVSEMASLAAGSAEARQNEMAVLSNSMSEEDFEEFRKNGGHITDVDSSEIVTVVDKIKIHLAESGTDVGRISASKDAIDSISGGRVSTDQAAKILSAADLPATSENISDTKKAFELASSLTDFSNGAVKYMAANELPGTIQNLYYAENGAGANYAEATLSDDAAAEIEEQMQRVIEGASLPVTEETMEESRWMVANELPLTEENLTRVDTLRHMELPFEKEEIFSAITEAISEGKRPQDAELVRLMKANRVLTETQLRMTEEARLSMSRRGFEIDTTELREKVDALIEKENALYERLLQDAGAEVDEVSLGFMRETLDAVDEIRLLPAYTLSIPEADTDSLLGIREAGRSLKLRMDQAGERYEIMETKVRRDLGDSIQKAFRNTDELLRDLSLPETEMNRRAIRILGYNEMEITEESVLGMKAKDEEVQRALKGLTPAVVARMVKENINPLEMNLSELNQRTRELQEGIGVPEEGDYAEYLYKLEHNRNISEEERESYIGIFRLLHQIEKNDGAAIGALIRQNAELSMRNLLTAIRSGKRSFMDYKVDDDFEGVQGKTYGKDILTQINTAFDEASYQTNVMRDIAEEMSPEAFRTLMKNDADFMEQTPEEFLNHLREVDTREEERLFTRSEMETFAEAASSEEEVFRMLEQYDLPNTAANVLAVQQFTSLPNAAIRRLFGANPKEYQDENGETDFEKIKNDLIRSFGEAVSEPEELAEAQKNLAETAENVMKTMLSEENGVRTELDVRSLKMMTNRFRLAGRMSAQENYHIPVLVKGETGEINLKIVSGKEEKGIVDIMFSLSSLGSVAAKLRMEDGRLTGFVAADRRETVDAFSSRGGELTRAFTGIEGVESVSIHPVFEERLDLTHFNASTEEENSAFRRENGGGPVRTPVLYKIAKSFLSALNSF